MFAIVVVFIFLALIYAFFTLNVGKNIEKQEYMQQFLNVKNSEYFKKIPDIYDKVYDKLHLSNYKHYKDNDGFRYKDKILLSNRQLCDIDSNYVMSNCSYYPDYPDLNNDDLKVLYEFLPPPTDSQQKLTGLIFIKNSFVPTINNIKIPMIVLEFATLEKTNSNQYKFTNIVRSDTYNTVNKKIEMADNIIENISQYVRHYAKTKFKTSNYNPFVSEFGLTKLYYYDMDIDSKSHNKKFVRLQGSLGYGLITSKMKMMPNSYTYKTGLNVFVPAIENTNNVWDASFNNNYSISEWDSYNGTRIYYALTWLNTDCLFDDKWYTNYDYDGIYDDFYKYLDDNTYLVGINEQAAIKKEVSILNHTKEVDIKIKTVKEYFNDMFNINFDLTNFENPFYGPDYPFDILIDNSSNLPYPYTEITNDTQKIVNKYKITFALPAIVDHIDDNVEDNNEYKGIYYRTYVITTVK